MPSSRHKVIVMTVQVIDTKSKTLMSRDVPKLIPKRIYRKI